MLTDTVQQANHVLSLSIAPPVKTAGISSKDEPVIIMPEMVNVVICPDISMSLKYQELITLLRYKIRWMRSTAHEIGRLAQGL
jgi:hypothetical protein